MNDAERILSIYTAIQRRLLEDRLLGECVRRVRLEKALDAIEADFIHWQQDTHMPAVVDNYVHNLGSEK